MATKKTTAKKSTATKKTTTKSAPKASAKTRTATENVADDVRAEAENFVNKTQQRIEDVVETTNSRVDSALIDAVKYSKAASYTTIGVPFALQNRIAEGKLADLESYKTLLDDAKIAGEQQYAEFEKLVEPYVKQVAEIVDPAVDKFESLLPAQLRTVLADNRERFEKIANA